MSARSNYLAAAESVSVVVARIRPEQWEGPGLGEWDLRSLVGHTSRSLVTVLTYPVTPAADSSPVLVPTATAYYTSLAGLGGATGASVAERGRIAGRALGADPAAGFSALIGEVRTHLETVADDDRIETILGAMRVQDYLPTRCFELVVHGLDIASATGGAIEFDPEVIADATVLAARVGAELGHGRAVLAALTGRGSLPGRFSVV